MRNAEWTVSAKNISSLGKRSPAFVTSHSSAFRNWTFNFAVSSLLLLTPSCSPLPPPNRNQRFHAAELAGGVSRSCPPIQACLCTALALGFFFQLVQLPSVQASTRSRVCQTKSALLWRSSVLDDNAAACQLSCDRAPHAGKPCRHLQAGVLLGEGTVWDHTKPLLQKQFIGRAVLSLVWMGLLAWLGFPTVGIKAHFPGIASFVQGILLV